MARKEVDKGRSRRIPVTALQIVPRLPVCLLPLSFANSLEPGGFSSKQHHHHCVGNARRTFSKTAKSISKIFVILYSSKAPLLRYPYIAIFAIEAFGRQARDQSSRNIIDQRCHRSCLLNYSKIFNQQVLRHLAVQPKVLSSRNSYKGSNKLLQRQRSLHSGPQN